MPQSNKSASINSWFSDNYGSRRGFARTCWHRFRYFLGEYRQYRNVDWKSVERLVFVCKGNICRSAYAEALARSQGAQTASCGLNTRIGLPANESAIRVASLKDIDLSAHKTTPIENLMLKNNDLFIVMEPWQAEFLKKKHGDEYKCTLLGLWGHPENPHIQDPFGMSDAYFYNCFNYIEKSVHEILSKLS